MNYHLVTYNLLILLIDIIAITLATYLAFTSLLTHLLGIIEIQQITDSSPCIISGRLSCHRSGTFLMGMHFLTDSLRGLYRIFIISCMFSRFSFMSGEICPLVVIITGAIVDGPRQKVRSWATVWYFY